MSRRIADDLPPPSPEAQAVSARLCDRIAAEIGDAGGWISFERFMEMALYEPGLGYYSAGACKLGRDGDFVTAPEISPLFGRCLAHQVAEIVSVQRGDAVLEFGAGSGRLAADLLEELGRLARLPAQYLILEVSADLRARQQELLRRRLPDLAPRIEWLDALPAEFSGVVLANEVLDAMPVARFRKAGADGCVELGVRTAGGGFAWSESVPGAELATRVAAIERECGTLPPGYTSEVSLRLAPWMRGVAACLRRGVVFVIDYGSPRREFYHPQRRDGTLLCHHRHRVHADPFLHVGLQDITAAVDFTAAAEAADAAGLAIAGYASQAQFLLALGLTDRLQEAIDADPQQAPACSRQIKMLTLPGEMGEHFKVLALSRGVDAELRGFSSGNRVDRL